MTDLPKIVYIAGYGRSGSTLLDVLLGNEPSVLGVGEVTRLATDMASGPPCSCGEPYEQCSFWCEVLGQLGGDPARRFRAVEGLDGSWPFGSKRRQYCRFWSELFSILSAVSGATVIVDSSKATRTSYLRNWQLRRCGFEVFTVHLIRDPRAVMWSVRRGSNRKLELGGRSKLPGGAARGLVGWMLSNLLVEVVSALGRVPALRVRYEDLVGDPVQELRRIGRFAGLDVESVVHRLRYGTELSPGHGVGGNRMRRAGPIRLSNDDEWTRRLPAHDRFFARLAWPLARRYGYSWQMGRGTGGGCSRGGPPQETEGNPRASVSRGGPESLGESPNSSR